MVQHPRVAIVCDWLTNMGGAEKVVLALHHAFPDAPIYTSVFDAKGCPEFAGLDVRTTYLQNLPAKVRAKHQLFPTFRTNAFRSLDLSAYDIVISSASAEAKAVRVRPGAVHICYCHTPTRYYWSHYHEYLAEPGLGPLNPAVRVAMPALVHFMRRADLKAAAGVTAFIANSSTVAARIKKYYHRDSTVIHPPVDVARFADLPNDKRHGFIVVGRQVPYKRIDLAVQACTKLGLPLTVYGEGPEHHKLTQLAGDNVEFVVGANDQQIAQALASAQAFIMPQFEDFGIVQIEAMAAGTPVIAFGQGGALDAIMPGKTGLFFKEQTVASLSSALQEFKNLTFDHAKIKKHAAQFSQENFRHALRRFVADIAKNNKK